MGEITNIYLIRHAEAEGNLYRRIQGQYNSKITPLGEKQILALVNRMKKIPYKAVISSDLLRATDTAQRLAQIYNLKVIQKKELREIAVGCWEDKPWGNLAQEYPKQMDNFLHDIEQFVVEGSEKINLVKKRMKEVILQIAYTFAGETVLIVSHGTAITAFFSEILEVPCAEVKRKYGTGDNTAVSYIQVIDNKIDICYGNDASHLIEGISTYYRQKKWRESEKQMDGVYFVPAEVKDINFFSKGNSKKVIAKVGKDKVGLMVLDVGQEELINAGEVLYCWVDPLYRKQRIGIQLLGYAVSTFRELGRERIILSLRKEDKEALSFFIHAGFQIDKSDRQKISLIMDIVV